MLLAIAVENTRTLVGVLDGETVVEHWLVSTAPARTADEWTVLLRGLVGSRPVTGVAVCSAVPRVLHELRDVGARSFADVPQVIVEPGIRTGLRLLVDNPRELGADRIANALAASQLYGAPCVVVDFGTATTFDVVDRQGAYIGGAIAPGIEVSLEALGRSAAQLRRVELTRPRSVVAKNTVEALQSGAVFGFAGQVDGIVGRILAELGGDGGEVAVVATGALAPVVIDECRSVTKYEPLLTLRGLRIAFERNR